MDIQFSQLSHEIADKLNASRSDTYQILRQVFPTIFNHLKNMDRVVIDGYGAFEAKKGFKYNNIKDGKKVVDENLIRIKFRFSQTARDKINGKPQRTKHKNKDNDVNTED